MIHHRLKSARVLKGLRQEEVASELGFSQAYLSRLESGDKGVTPEMLGRLAALYGVSESYLSGDNPADTDARVVTTVSLRQQFLADDSVAPGLRALAADEVLVAALAITPEEWRDLKGCDLSFQASKTGYVLLLTTIRAMARA